MEENKIFKFNTKELKETINGDNSFAKFELNKQTEIQVLESKDIEEVFKEFDGQKTKRFRIYVMIDGEEKVWDVSSRVLRTIDEVIEKTNRFLITRRDKNYDVFPMGL